MADSATEIVLTVLTTGSIPALATLLFQARRKNKLLTAEATKTDAEGVKVITDTAIHMMKQVTAQLQDSEKRGEALKSQLDSAIRQVAEAKDQLRELTAELEHQRSVTLEMTSKMEQANNEARFWHRKYEEEIRKGN